MIESMPAVRRCRVVGLPHAVLGTIPVAEVVLHFGASLTARELIRQCRQSLSAYKVPVRVRFVDALPLTQNGKVRRV